MTYLFYLSCSRLNNSFDIWWFGIGDTANTFIHCTSNWTPPPQVRHLQATAEQQRGGRFVALAAKSGGFSLNSAKKGCQTCKGQGAIECPGCKGTGKNKKNGNIFERWKCFDCQGFGLKSCPSCGKRGLTPEQRGER